MSGDGASSKQESTGLLRRMFKRVSNPRDSDEGYSPGNLSSEKKTQMLIHKQRNDLERKREFEELRRLYDQRQQKNAKEDDVGENNEVDSQLSGGDMSKGSTKQTDTLDKINQLESQMATRWTNKADVKGSGASAAKKGAVPRMEAPQISDLSELADPFLEEIAVLFASNEDEQVEQSLLELVGEGSPQRTDQATWLTLMDFYRAIGKQAPYEKAALSYMSLFSESAPQWQVFDSTDSSKQQAIQASAMGNSSYWAAPATLDEAAAREMGKVLLDPSKPARIMDWGALQDITPEGAKVALAVMDKLDKPEVLLQVAALSKVMGVLAEKVKIQTESGVTGEEVFWQLRLELLRFFDTAEGFDMEAMEFCLAHEVSPPSWTKPKNKAEDMDAVDQGLDDGSATGLGQSSTIVGDFSTQFYGQNVKSPLRLKGAYKGSMDAALKELDTHIFEGAGYLMVNCDKLIRVDFSAAGDLLNWISEKSARGYSVHFVNVHRLTALFFIVMGITVAAQVSLRKD